MVLAMPLNTAFLLFGFRCLGEENWERARLQERAGDGAGRVQPHPRRPGNAAEILRFYELQMN